MLEMLESTLLELGPYPRLSFMSEQVKGGNNVGEVWDEFSVEVCKYGEQSNSFD